jgi:hypothetical protein
VEGCRGLYLVSMDQVRDGLKGMYEAPALKVVGSVYELTLHDKKLGPTDGFTLMGAPISNNSP